MGKAKQKKKGKKNGVHTKTPRLSYKTKVLHCSVIAKPMARKKLAKKIYELIEMASNDKNFLKTGLKVVQKQLRDGVKGLVFFAGDISPIEIMCHLPAVCEDKDIPYCFIPSRRDIGAAIGTMRGCTMVLVQKHEAYEELYNEVQKKVKLLLRLFLPL